METTNLSTLKIHKLTENQYKRELEAGRIDENAIYLTPEVEYQDLGVLEWENDIHPANALVTEGKYRYSDDDIVYSIIVVRPIDRMVGQLIWGVDEGIENLQWRTGYQQEDGTWSFYDWAFVSPYDVVKYATTQSLTDSQKSKARTNIGAFSSAGGTFEGQVVANASGQDAGTSLLRNSKLVSADTDPTVNGEICWTYE